MIIVNEDVLSIKYYDEIIKLQDFQIQIKIKDKFITISGKGLSIQYYSEHEIIVHGSVESMVFK